MSLCGWGCMGVGVSSCVPVIVCGCMCLNEGSHV